MKKKLLSLALTIAMVLTLVSITAMPVRAEGGISISAKFGSTSKLGDAVFEQIDANKDAYLSEEEIANATKFNITASTTIHSLDGMEIFTNLEELYCNGVSLGTLDVSAFTKLKVLDCNNTGISALDLRQYRTGKMCREWATVVK